ncbi:MAG: hypothetical protein M1832_004840 [Thelocarpon impressellum]|nr:MAG: hypothetical protein M1832_004840 [Thelocarpon impressellum]
MAPLRRVIIDTDPGVDDVLALLLALSAEPEELEVMLLSVTFGNVEVQSCLRNIVSMFHVLEKEFAWRKQRGQADGFDALRAHPPIVAVGAEKPLEDQLMMADYFHGADGLGGVHSSHPHLTPQETWRTLFHPPPAGSTFTGSSAQDLSAPSVLFKPSHLQAHKEILRLLNDNEPDTITIVAIGPLTNLALAAVEDPETFLRAKEVVVMGGAVETMGNVTPVAEFNAYADAVAAARVFALTSMNPLSTFPPAPPPSTHSPAPPYLPQYPSTLSKQLNLTLFPLDVTTTHWLRRADFEAATLPLASQGSPLAEWVGAFVGMTFEKIGTLSATEPHLSLHDPLCIWYLLPPPSSLSPPWSASPGSPEDIRIETAGQWTRGMCISDRRPRRRAAEGQFEVPGDTDGWLSARRGNRVTRIVASPSEEGFAGVLLERIFGAPAD